MKHLKPLLGLLIAGALMAASLTGCSKRAEALTANSRPASGGELVFAFDGAAVATFPLDPQRSPYAPHNRIMRSIFDSLVVLQANGEVGPWLATAWHTSSDGRATTFKLRQDVTFHDGTRFDAAAVKANLDRIADPKNALFAANDLIGYKSSTVVDDFSVRVEFTTPFAPLLAQLSKTNFGMISPAAIAKYGEQLPDHPVGTGPFKVASITPGVEVVLERFEAYRWPPAGSSNPGAAHLQRLVFKNVPEEATRVAVLENGQAQAADLIPPQNLVQFRQRKDLDIVEGELLNHNYALFLNLKRAPWNEVRVRQALRQALDLDAAVKTIYLGTAQRAWSPLSPSVFGYDKTLEGSWKADLAAARQALDELGWKPGADGVREKSGKRLTLGFLDGQGNREKRLDLVTLLRRQLKEAGIELRIDSQPGGNYLDRIKSGDWDLLGASQFTPDPDVLRRLYSPLNHSATSFVRVDDPELTQWLERGYQTLDPAERKRLYGLAQHRIVEAVYAIPVYVLDYPVTETNRVRGITVDRHGFPEFQQAWVAQK